MESAVGIVLVAAGEGTRFGGPKAFVELLGRTLLERSAAAFAAIPDRVAVLRREDVARAALPGWKLVRGGTRRRDSVAAGIAALDRATRTVLVHDAARPLVPPDLVGRVLARAATAAAVVPVVPVVDTIKRVLRERVEATLDRSELFAVQTPQAYRLDLLRRALGASGGDATDEAVLVEGLGEEVVTVPGDPCNLKITAPLDLLLAQAILRG